MTEMSRKAMMGTGEATGEGRALDGRRKRDPEIRCSTK